ncbi:hypothetical protein MauCBS54593_007242 [Microsporum audouinii]
MYGQGQMATHLGVAISAIVVLGLPLYQLGIPDLHQLHTMGWASIIRILAYYTVYPLVFFSSIFISTLRFLAAPLIELSSHLLYISLLPWRMSTKLEPLYKFFGVAAVIGVATGWALYLSSTYIFLLLNLSPSPRAVSSHWKKHGQSRTGGFSAKSDWATQFVNSSDNKDDFPWRPTRESTLDDPPKLSGLRYRRSMATKMSSS